MNITSCEDCKHKRVCQFTKCASELEKIEEYVPWTVTCREYEKNEDKKVYEPIQNCQQKMIPDTVLQLQNAIAATNTMMAMNQTNCYHSGFGNSSIWCNVANRIQM